MILANRSEESGKGGREGGNANEKCVLSDGAWILPGSSRLVGAFIGWLPSSWLKASWDWVEINSLYLQAELLQGREDVGVSDGKKWSSGGRPCQHR